MDRNLQAAAYLELLSPQRLPLAGDLAFRSQLQRITFDYSLASLAQVDRMLQELRGTMKVDYQAFMQKQQAVNFVVALTHYLGAAIARSGNFALKWITHDEACRSMPGLPLQLETDLACVIGNGIYFPAGVVTEMLFDPNQERTCVSFAAKITERLNAEGHRMPDPVPRPSAVAAPNGLSAGWKDALDGAGALGAWGMFELAEGVQPKPTMMVPGATGRITVDFATFNHTNMEDAIADGRQRLEFNAENAAWQALDYDGFLNLPTGRRDALIVELRIYQPAPAAPKSLLGGLFKGKQAPAPAKTALSLTMALPYRLASDPLGFANFSPRLVDCSYRGPELPALLDTFYRGVLAGKPFQWDARFAGD